MKKTILVWDEAATNCLRASSDAGNSRSQIAEALHARGYAFTDKAIRRKLQRLGMKSPGRTATWSDAAVTILREYASLGSSAVRLALQQHGYHFERKQILRKTSSLGLTVPRLRVASDKDVFSAHSSREQLKQVRIAASEAWANRPDDEPLPDSRPITLINLRFHHCRWPLGRDADGDRLFCGAGKMTGSRYCPTHFNLSRKKETTYGTQKVQQVA